VLHVRIGFTVVVAFFGLMAAPAPARYVPSVVAKPCRSGTKPAVIGGRHVCLKAGQRCNPALDRQYHRYGFHCHGSRRLTPKTTPVPPPRFVDLRVTGPPQVVFDWSKDRCEDLDIPDLPARAFRDADGRTQLIASHFVNRRMIGSDLDHLARDCSVVLMSDFNPDPAAFDDHEWIAAPYSPDGRTVYALLHDEYQGNTHPGRCASGEYYLCWYNTITLAISKNAGATYADKPLPRLVASVPYQYVPDQGPIGVFTPSNIVQNPNDGLYYSFVYVNIRNSHIGSCLMRTHDLSDPSSWRAWTGGLSFDLTFIDPYRSVEDPSAHLCTGVDWEPRDLQPNSLTYNSVARQWLLVGQALQGAYYTVSKNLVDWTQPRLFYSAQVTWDYQCGDPDPIAYPSLLDPASTSRNYETSGNTAFLYYTQFHYSGCQQTLDRDLVRVPIEIR